jgi:hypothetical protein
MQTATQGAACSIWITSSDSTASLQAEIDGFLNSIAAAAKCA